MLKLTVPKREFFNEATNKFIHVPETQLELEHSLISIKKWEAKWHVSFLNTKDKTDEQVLDYIYFMCIKPVDKIIIDTLSQDLIQQILEYIGNPMTATTVTHPPKKEGQSNKAPEILTAELIYYYMIVNNIPVEFQKWHFNQLATLLDVFSAKNEQMDKKNRMDPKTAAMHRQALNAKRRAKHHSRG